MTTVISDELNMINALLMAGKYEEAYNKLQKILQINPRNVEALFLAGELDLRMGRIALAKERLNEVKEFVKEKGRILFDLGNISMAEGSLRDALRFYTMSETEGFDTVRLITNMAVCHDLLDEKEKAIELFTRAIEREPNNLRALSGLTKILIVGGDFVKAINIAKKLAQSYPKNFEGIQYLSIALLALDKNDEAIGVLEEAKENHAGNIQYQYSYVIALRKQERFQEILDRLSAFSRDQLLENPLFIKEKARALIATYRTEDAIVLLQQLIDEKKADSEIEFMLATLLYGKHDFALASALFKQASDRNDHSVASCSARYLQATALRLNGQIDEARLAFKQTYDFLSGESNADPASAFTYILRSYCCKEMGQYSEALWLLDFVEQLIGTNAELHNYREELNQLINA